MTSRVARITITVLQCFLVSSIDREMQSQTLIVDHALLAVYVMTRVSENANVLAKMPVPLALRLVDQGRAPSRSLVSCENFPESNSWPPFCAIPSFLATPAVSCVDWSMAELTLPRIASPMPWCLVSLDVRKHQQDWSLT